VSINGGKVVVRVGVGPTPHEVVRAANAADPESEYQPIAPEIEDAFFSSPTAPWSLFAAIVLSDVVGGLRINTHMKKSYWDKRMSEVGGWSPNPKGPGAKALRLLIDAFFKAEALPRLVLLLPRALDSTLIPLLGFVQIPVNEVWM
jgi:hypothetical protein